jgi:hypothetical protein
MAGNGLLHALFGDKGGKEGGKGGGSDRHEFYDPDGVGDDRSRWGTLITARLRKSIHIQIRCCSRQADKCWLKFEFAVFLRGAFVLCGSSRHPCSWHMSFVRAIVCGECYSYLLGLCAGCDGLRNLRDGARQAGPKSSVSVMLGCASPLKLFFV